MKYLNHLKSCLIGWFEFPLILVHVGTVCTQIYGELNRMRLIMSEKSKVGKKIEKFDKEYNKYYPFFDNEENYEKYQAMKGKIK